MGEALLEVDKVNVRFGGVHAVNDVDLVAEPGMVTGLIGPNGAGKTTTFNVVCGLQAPNSGRVLMGGDDITSLKPHERVHRGLARTFQRLEVFGSLSARENVLVAAEARERFGPPTDEDAGTRTDRLLDLVGLWDMAGERADALPTGLARLVELARALATVPSLLLLDEPTSGLDEDESDHFADLLLEMCGQGLGVLIVEHDVDVVMKVCRLIHVLDFGQILAVGTPEEIQSNAAVQTAYLGAGFGE